MRLAAIACAGVLALLALLFVLLLGAVDRGMFDGTVARLLSARFHRSIRFTRMKAHLLSMHPSLTVRGLVIDNPPKLGGGHLAEVRWLNLRFDRLALLHGSFRLKMITAHGLNLHLIRFGPMNNNWTFTNSPGSGPAFEPLRGVSRLSISDSRLDLIDYGRKMKLSGPFGQDTTGATPFYLSGGGMLAGYPIAAELRGGPLHGAAVGKPWPIDVRIVDGATMVAASGTSGDAFDLSAFDLGIDANGPNLADLGYLFHLIIPNSAPYRFRVQGHSDGTHYLFENLAGVVGHSDVRGWIKSDHSQARRQIRAAFSSRVLDRDDVDALLAPVPPRGKARAISGAVKGVGTSRWILPDAPFGLARIRATDFDFSVKAASVANFALPLRALSTDVSLEQGVLRFDRFSSQLYGGRLTGAASLDARQDVPRLVVSGRLSGARLSETMMGTAMGANARFDLSGDIHGTGRSVHDAAGRSTGTMAMRLKDGAVPRRAAWIMGGDLLRAIGASDKASNALPLTCAAADFGGSGGSYAVRAFKIQTPLGYATGAGTLDLGREQMHILLQGHPSEKRLFQVETPLRLDGPLLKPVLTILPADHARKLGLKGKLGIALSPITGLLPLGHDKLPAAPTGVGC